MLAGTTPEMLNLKRLIEPDGIESWTETSMKLTMVAVQVGSRCSFFHVCDTVNIFYLTKNGHSRTAN